VRKRTCTWQAPRRAAYPTNKIKDWRGLATRFDKKPESYMAGLQLRGAVIWLRSLDPAT
jgi:transposase